MGRQLRIGEAARLLGVSTKTIRHYQRIGLLAEPARSAGGYRLYGGEDLRRLLSIRQLTALGLPLARIRDLLARPEDGQPLRRALEGLAVGLRAEIGRLAERLAVIERLLAGEDLTVLEAPTALPADVDRALGDLRGKLSGVDPATLDRALDLDRRLLGLLHAFALPPGFVEQLRERIDELAEDPSPLSSLLPLIERWIALAEAPEDAPEIATLARELADALPARLTEGAGAFAGAPLGDVLAELARGTLSPAQSRALALLRERLAERAAEPRKSSRHRAGRPRGRWPGAAR